MSIGPITRLSTDRLHQLESLLVSNNLPADDCVDRADCFYGMFDNDRLVAAGGLETVGPYALLRSVVVHPQYRGRGVARVMSEFLLQQARSQNIAAVYLLTETAAAYFEKLGFSHVTRTQVPAEIANTRQFSSLCPDSASCLMTELSTG